jgi:putative NADH-flavin reductase
MKTVSPSTRVVVVGAVGATGSVVLRELLGSGRHDTVTVLTTRRFLRTPPGMAHVVVDAAAWHDALPPADHAVLVFGAVRRDREALIWQPARAELLPLATALRGRGVRTLDVVGADGSSLSAAERKQLQALAFERVAEPQPGSVSAAPVQRGSWPERLAAWMIRTVLAAMRQLMVTQH